jgi:hypothetical protein
MMRKWITWKTFAAVALLTVLSAALLMAANSYAKPKSVIHVVTLYWQPGTTPEQIQKVLDGVEGMAKEIPGIKNVWLKSTRVQGTIGENRVTHAFVIEFESEAAAKAYGPHPAHKKWEELYVPLRGASRSFQITN